MSADYARWLATETAATLNHDRPCAPCSSTASGEIRHGPLGCPAPAARKAAARATAPDDDCLTDVPMVCTICRKPVTRGETTGLWFHSDTSDPERCSRTVPVKAMVEAGNENVPRAGTPLETSAERAGRTATAEQEEG